MYEKYVIDMKNKYNLSIKQCQHLLSMLTLSLIFKTISARDIVFKDDKIEHIEGIEFSNGKVNFLRPFIQKSERQVQSTLLARLEDNNEETEYKSMRENWIKFIKTECERIS